MHAWTISGEPTPHLEPWGADRGFLHPSLVSKSIDSLSKRLIWPDCLNRRLLLQLPWIPGTRYSQERLDQYLSKSTIEEGLIRICLFEDSIGISDRPAESDGKPVEGWLMQYRRPIPRCKINGRKRTYTEDYLNLIFLRGLDYN